MRLAYADPPYPGKSHLYPEKTEVDHTDLITRLCEYDGWALSTDENALAYVLSLCPSGIRVLAWCRNNAPPLLPFPIRSWEPVILQPARTQGIPAIRSYLVSPAPIGWLQADGLTGQKTPAFCEWVFRAMGALPGDTLDDLFPGTGIVSRTWQKFTEQLPLFAEETKGTRRWRERLARKIAEPLPGMPIAEPIHKISQEERRGAA